MSQQLKQEEIATLTHKHKHRKLDFARAKLCLEAYPRSANSLACHLISPSLEKYLGNCSHPFFIHHTHDVDVVKTTSSLKIPTIIIIRNPEDAVSSLCIYNKGAIDLEILLRRWIRFYFFLNPSNRKNILVARFETVVTDFNNVIDAINEKFKFDLEPIADLDGAMKLAKQKSIKASKSKHGENFIYYVGSPDTSREQMKIEIKDKLHKLPLLNEAKRLFASITPDV